MENVENFFTIQKFPEKFSTFHKKHVENVENTFCTIEIGKFLKVRFLQLFEVFSCFFHLGSFRTFFPFVGSYACLWREGFAGAVGVSFGMVSVAGCDVGFDLLDGLCESGAFFHLAFDLLDGVDDGAVVPSAEVFSDLVL